MNVKENVTTGKPCMESTDIVIDKNNLRSVATVQDQREKLLSSMKNEERQKCEVWSRVMGYHRPVSGYNVGKKQEFSERRYFKEAQDASN